MTDIIVITPPDLDHDTVIINSNNRVQAAIATGTQAGVTTLTNDYPASGNNSAVTPDYINEMLAEILLDVFE